MLQLKRLCCELVFTDHGKTKLTFCLNTLVSNKNIIVACIYYSIRLPVDTKETLIQQFGMENSIMDGNT